MALVWNAIDWKTHYKHINIGQHNHSDQVVSRDCNQNIQVWKHQKGNVQVLGTTFSALQSPFPNTFYSDLVFNLSTISAGSPFWYADVGFMTLVHSKGQKIFAKCQMFGSRKAKWFVKNRPNISWRIGQTFYSARFGCPCMATHRRSSPPGTYVSGPTKSGKCFDCWFEQFCKVGLIAIDWEIFHLIAWSIFCTLVFLVHKLQGKKTALGSKLPHILAQRLPQGALQSLFIYRS